MRSQVLGVTPAASSASCHPPADGPHRSFRLGEGLLLDGGSTLELVIIFGIPFAAGFAAGYAVRAYISYRNRQLARRYSPLPSGHVARVLSTEAGEAVSRPSSATTHKPSRRLRPSASPARSR